MGLAAKVFYWTALCLVTVTVFIFVVLVRITTPRFKLESLSKLSWGPSFAVVAASVTLYALGFFLG